MRMNTGGGEQALAAFIELLAQLQGLLAALDAGAGQHQLAYARGIGALEYGLMFVGETGVGQVDADIDELHGCYLGPKAGKHTRAVDS
ncbi:hypothetical protein D3C74_455000 [compost metagenome]